jgi:Coenzyme PQQ synthesis protein D (PqqD)/AhpC/TSA family
VTEPSDIHPDDIDGGFVPVARPDAAAVAVGHELVLGRIAAGTTYLQTCALNESGSIVWQCFDGSGTIDEIAADVADVFDAQLEAVAADITALARQVGSAGFLEGVREQVLEIEDAPSGIAVGLPFPDFVAVDEYGTPFSARQLRGRRALLVSWSPTCRFCRLIVGDIGALVPSLAAVGVDLVVVATGGADANRESLDGNRFAGLLLLRDEAAEGFAGMGTPVAYILDEQGIVAEPVALGATEVVQLARAIVSSSAFT